MIGDFDVVVAGSGFAGSLAAAIVARQGYRVALVERGRHPRFAIGESTSPLANLLLEELASRYDLTRLAPLSTYGAWMNAHPSVTRGIKRGFTFFQHEAGARHRASRETQLLVAASPNDAVADTHWLRSEVDAHFVDEAIRAGVEYLDITEIARVEIPGAGRRATLAGTRAGKPVRLSARFVVDATGPGGLVARALGISRRSFARFPATQSLYGHFTSIARCDEMPDFRVGGTPPYPLDDAALHHLFDGGWMWVLRFDSGVTSAGFVVEERMAREVDWKTRGDAWRSLLSRFPSIREQFASAEPLFPLVASKSLAFRAESAAGDGWAMLPSAAGFVDPLFSTGFPLTLLGVERLSRAFERDGLDHFDAASYDALTLGELDHTARYVAGAYAAFGDMRRFAPYSMFYFAAASFAETARRVGRPELAARFLALDRREIVAAISRHADTLQRDDAPATDEMASEIARELEPINVAGLCDPAKRNWYGVDLEDAVAGAAKLGVEPERVRAALEAASRG